MTARTRLIETLPYLVVLVAAGFLWRVADNFQHTPMPGQIGPDFWPKMMLGLMSVCCIYEIMRRLVSKNTTNGLGADDFEAEAAALENIEDHPWLVIFAMVASVIYLVSLDYIGFFVATLIYVAVLEWLGGVRRALTFITTTIGMTIFFTFMFSTVIYVALPLGQGVFQAISLAVLKLLWAQ